MSNSNANLHTSNGLPCLRAADEQEEHKARIALAAKAHQRELRDQEDAINQHIRPRKTREEKQAQKTPTKSSILKPQATNAQERQPKRITPQRGPSKPVKKVKRTFQGPHLQLEGLMCTFIALFLRLSPGNSDESENMPTKSELEALLEMQGRSLQGRQDDIEELMIDLQFPGNKHDIRDFQRHVKTIVGLCESKAKTDAANNLKLKKELELLRKTKKVSDGKTMKPPVQETQKTATTKALKELNALKVTHKKALAEWKDEDGVTFKSKCSKLAKEADEHVKAHETLLHENDDMKKVTQELEEAQMLVGSNRTQQDAATPVVMLGLKKTNDELTLNNQKLSKRNEKLTSLLSAAKKELKKAGKSTADERNLEVLDAAKKYLKEHHFCLVQFVKNKEDSSHVLKHLTRPVYKGIKETHILGEEDPIDVKEFHRIYRYELCSYLNDLRAGCLTRMNKAVKEFFREHKKIPTMAQMSGIWTMNWNTHEVSKSILRWYVHKWLPALAVEFDKETRLTLLPMEQGMICGKKRVCVPIQIEAHGLMMHENNYQKWKAIYDKTSEQPDFKPPSQCSKKNPDSLKYTECKWSSGSAGQGKGWKPEAFTALATHKTTVKEFRDEDHEDNWSTSKLALQMLRDEAGLEEGQSPSKKKRKRADECCDVESWNDTREGESSDEEEMEMCD